MPNNVDKNYILCVFDKKGVFSSAEKRLKFLILIRKIKSVCQGEVMLDNISKGWQLIALLATDLVMLYFLIR